MEYFTFERLVFLIFFGVQSVPFLFSILSVVRKNGWRKLLDPYNTKTFSRIFGLLSCVLFLTFFSLKKKVLDIKFEEPLDLLIIWATSASFMIYVSFMCIVLIVMREVKITKTLRKRNRFFYWTPMLVYILLLGVGSLGSVFVNTVFSGIFWLSVNTLFLLFSLVSLVCAYMRLNELLKNIPTYRDAGGSVDMWKFEVFVVNSAVLICIRFFAKFTTLIVLHRYPYVISKSIRTLPTMWSLEFVLINLILWLNIYYIVDI